ncbi:kinase-like protein, partial [Auricularia subglabra TFB-10046 SS5]
MTSPGGKLYPRPRLARFVPFYGRVKLIKVIETDEDGRQYSLARLRWLWASQTTALHESTNMHVIDFLDTLSQRRGLRDRSGNQNVHEVFGMCKLGTRDFVVTSYYSKGRLLPYLKATPSLDRRDYVLHVASGLEFLHAHGIIHGDLSSRNVFISDSGNGVLSGFPCRSQGPASTAQPLVTYWQAVKDRHEPREAEDSDAPHEFLVEPMQNWIKPRPIVQDDPVDSAIRLEVAADLRSTDAAGDIVGFGFLIIEIFVELGPTDCQSALRLLRMVKKGLRPPYPGAVGLLRGLDDLHWDVCLKCWATERQERITSQELVERLRRADNVVRPAFEQSPEGLAAWVASRVPRLETQITDAHDVRDGRDAERGLYEVEGTLEQDGGPVRVKIITPFIARRATLRRRH